MPDDRRPRCTVIICVRNGAATIGAQLSALTSQQGAPPFEVLVVDNGSTDATREVYEEWSSRVGDAPGSRLIDASDRVGLPHARNVGACHASTDVLVYCDADDVVSPGWVRAAWDAIGVEGHGAVSGPILALDEQGRPDDAVIMDELDGIGASPGAVHDYPFFWGCNFALARAAFSAAGGFDESLPPYGCDDLDIGIRLGLQAIDIAYSPTMQVHYRLPSGPRQRLRRKFRAGVAQACVWQRHPTVYEDPSGLQTLLATPGTLARVLRDRGSAQSRLRRSAELLAQRAGEMWGVFAWVRSGRLGPAEYVSSTH